MQKQSVKALSYFMKHSFEPQPQNVINTKFPVDSRLHTGMVGKDMEEDSVTRNDCTKSGIVMLMATSIDPV